LTDSQSLRRGVILAIIVDKVQKKKDIALSCKALFLAKGIQKITIAEIAKTAGVGKGTIYEYFHNKEEILFALVNILMQEHDTKKQIKLQNALTTKEQIKIFTDFFYEDACEELRLLYKRFLSINLMDPNEQIIEFHTLSYNKYFTWFKEIIQKGIDTKELIPESIHLAKGLFVVGEGLFLAQELTNNENDIKEELNDFIETLFKLIEVKK